MRGVNMTYARVYEEDRFKSFEERQHVTPQSGCSRTNPMNRAK